MKKEFVISLGGSIVVPGKIDTKYLFNFKQMIERNLKDHKYYIIVGGGNLARDYQNAGREVKKEMKNDDLDWIGIQATKLNAQLVRSVFGDIAYKDIFREPDKVKFVREKIYVGGGWKPGRSTDYVATRLASKLGVKTVINLSNIDYVYDKDPNKYKNAKPIQDITWKEFRKLVGGKWVPGAHVPFDPEACKLAEKSGLDVIIMNGKKLDQLEQLIRGVEFNGTIIR